MSGDLVPKHEITANTVQISGLKTALGDDVRLSGLMIFDE
jgi:hypothetical protein